MGPRMNDVAIVVRPVLMLSAGFGLVVAGVSAWFRHARALRVAPKFTMTADLLVTTTVSPWAGAPALGLLSVVAAAFLLFFGGLDLVGAVYLRTTCIEGGGAIVEGTCTYGVQLEKR